MSIIKVTVDDQALYLTESPVVAAQGVNENYFQFILSADWSGFGVVALFWKEGNETDVYESVVDGTGKALVPHEVTANPGRICVGLAGVNGNIIHTSEILKYKVVKGKYTAGQSSEPPSPGIYEQMLSLAGQMSTQFQQVVQEQAEIIEDLQDDQTALRSELTAQQTTFQNTVSGQMAAFIASQSGDYGATVLWDMDTEGDHNGALGQDTVLTLRENVENFDFLEIWGFNTDTDDSVFIPVEKLSNSGTAVKSANIGIGTTKLRIVETRLVAQYNELTIAHQFIFTFDTTHTATRITQDNKNSYVSQFGITRVIGRKMVQNAELTDIRVGQNGTTYQTAGAAVRGQFTEVKAQIPLIDATLATAGKAADAKATGDAFTAVNGRLDDLEIYKDANVIFEGSNISKIFPTTGSTFVEISDGKIAVTPNTTYTLFFDGLSVTDDNGNTLQDVSDYGVRVLTFAEASGDLVNRLSYYTDQEGTNVQFTTGSTINFVTVNTLARSSGKKDYTVSIDELHIYPGSDGKKHLSLKDNVALKPIDDLNNVVSGLDSRLDAIEDVLVASTPLFDGAVSGTFPSSTSTSVAVIEGRLAVVPEKEYTLYFDGLTVTDDNGNPVQDVSDYGIRLHTYEDLTGSLVKRLSYYVNQEDTLISFIPPDGINYININVLAKTSGKKDYTISVESVKIYPGEDVESHVVLDESVIVPQVDALGSRLLYDVLYPDVPMYYNTYLTNKIATIKAKSELCGAHGDAFIFFTDYHYAQNAGNSLFLIKAILDQCPYIDKVVFGGDVLNSHTQAYAKTLLYKFADEIRILDPVVLFGNHELNTMSANPETTGLSFDVAYSIIGKQNERHTENTNGWHFVIDNASQKIRFIFLDTGTNGNIGYVSSNIAPYQHQADQRVWLLNTLRDTENGWNVLVLGHWFFTAGELTTNGGGLVKGILDAVKGQTTYAIGGTTWDFSNKSLNIIGAISGHSHVDLLAQDTGSYPIFATTTDAYGQASESELIDGELRSSVALGTVYEQAFDVVQIDTSARKIYTTRIGYGSDRELIY